MAAVPKKMHFIWVGTQIFEKYVENIKEWIKQNPDYKAYLWIDTATIPPQRVNDALSQVEAILKARETGANVIDLAAPDNHFLETAPNARWYNEEATGFYANYAAASDILRLTILLEGGVYIDTDILNGAKPLGDIEVKQGFSRPKGFYNDVMCAAENSELVQEFVARLNMLYERVYQQDDLAANIELELHRHSRPWKERVPSTIEMSGIGPIDPVIDQKIAQIQNEQGIDAALEYSRDIFDVRLSEKFVSRSDQTWVDKGPKNLQEEHLYFREEFKCRLKQAFLTSLERRLHEKNVDPAKILRVMADVTAKVMTAPELMSIAEVLKSCSISEKKFSTTRKVVKKLALTISQLEQQVAGLSFNCSEDIQAARQSFFPHYRYNIVNTKDIANLNMAGKYTDIRECAKKVAELRL